MAWIPVVPPDNADERLRREYGRVREPDGSVDAIFQIHSLHPRSLRDHFELYATAMRRDSPLSRAQREMIAVVVSSINGCDY